MLDKRTEQGIDRYIAYIRRMNRLNDEQLFTVFSAAIAQNADSYMGTGSLEGHINHIRNMAIYTDDQLRKYLRESAKDPVILEIFESASKKKAVQDMKKMAKDITGDPTKFARKADREY